MAEAQDEKVYTAEYKFNYESAPALSTIKKPAGTSVRLSGSYQRAKSNIIRDWRDRVYLDANNVGTISFTNFKYEVKAVYFNVMAEPSGNLYDNITTTIKEFDGTSHSNSYRIGSIEGTSFHDNSFLDGGEFSSCLNGMKSMSMKQLTRTILGLKVTNTVYYKGANDTTTPTFTIAYYKPYATFNEKMPTAMKKGTKIALLNSMFNISHKGAFTDSDFSFESLDQGKIKIEGDYMVGVGEGVAPISVVIKNNGEVVNRTTINVSVYDGDYSWSQGLLYMDFDPNGNNPDPASYTGQPYDGLRLFDDTDTKRPYVWSKYEEKTNGNLSAAISTKDKKNDWRVAVGMLNYSQYVPAYASIKISYDFKIKSENKTNKYRHGAELLYFGETPWTENTSDKFTTPTSNIASEGNFTSVSSVVGYQNSAEANSTYSFEAFNNENSNARDILLRFGLKTFIRHYPGMFADADQMGSFEATNRQLETTYYAYVTFVGGEGCPYTMPKHDEGKNYKLYTSNNTYTSYTLGVNDYVSGYTFKGWSTEKGGPVVYQNNSQFNPYNEKTKGGKGFVTLYAVWEANSYTVTLDHNNGSAKKDVITATYGKDMPSVDKNGKVLVAPTKTGYVFDGYYSQDGNTKYYNSDMTSANKWTGTNPDQTLYARWRGKTYYVRLHACGGTLSSNVGVRGERETDETEVQTNYDTTLKEHIVDVTAEYASPKTSKFWCSEEITIKPGYKLVGWFTLRTGGEKIYRVGDQEHVFVAEKSECWDASKDGANWINDIADNNADNPLHLYAQYECKFEIVDNGERINFKEGYDITTQDIDAAIKEDNEVYNVAPMIVDITKYPKFINAGSGGYVNGKGDKFEGGEQAFKEALEDAREESKLAPNALVYLSDKSDLYSTARNVVMMKNEQCLNLVVTDRAPIKIPYAFKANNALYERNKNYSSEDGAVAQAANSKWGTLCLPYPIKNNSNNNVKFYKLAGLKNNYMHFTPMNEAVIPANTPVLYKRLEGVGSDVKIEEANVDVPVNANYSTNPGSSYDSWQFIGTLTTKIFCGKEYDDKKVPAGAEKMNGTKEIYYFKKDQFTHLSNTGKVTMLPYRAYFTTTAANAKVAAFSLVAIDEEGATDITNLVDGEAKGDGKIYDLNGRRVMQPVSGRLYIVDGKKKVY
jgi:uncharacterized repeat protein (TIGR02543 family)